LEGKKKKERCVLAEKRGCKTCDGGKWGAKDQKLRGGGVAGANLAETSFTSNKAKNGRHP